MPSSNNRHGRTGLCSELLATKATIALLGSFRRNDADDVEVFTSAVIRILMGYPPEVVQSVADPLTGIAGEQTFLPAPAEIKATCDRRYAPILARQERERRDEEFRRKRAEARAEEAAIEAERQHRGAVVADAMTKNGFTPKEYRHGRPVPPEKLDGLARERRLKEIEAAEADLERLASQPLPKLSDAALAAARLVPKQEAAE